VNGGLEARVRELENRATRWEVTLAAHLEACERRGARLERLGWAIGGFVLMTLISSLGTTLTLLYRALRNGGAG